ncbi:MAG: DUF1592 domain-containing protein [Acidobacteria bacterium]|nr:DUF1592 domain-containing protein [Acidobacteriota bacterium]
MRRNLFLAFAALIGLCGLAATGPRRASTSGTPAKPRAVPARRAPAATFDKTVQPFLATTCFACHNEKLKSGELDLKSRAAAPAFDKDRETWERVLHKIRTGEMPPKGISRPKPATVQAVTAWLDREFERIDRSTRPDPGRVTARRLNRYEYNNTVRDLLGIDFRPADDFPADDSGYGFDNIGDVLSLSPVLMEKYLAAAEKIAREAVVVNTPVKAVRERYKAELLRPEDNPLGTLLPLRAKHKFPAAADYQIVAGLGGIRPDTAAPSTLSIEVAGKQVAAFTIHPGRNMKRTFEFTVPIERGEQEVAVVPIGDTFKSSGYEPLAPRSRYLAIDYIEIRGPYNQRPLPPTDAHRSLFVCAEKTGDCARRILSRLARRAWRRPVAPAEIDSLSRFVRLAQHEGDSFEQGIRVALQAVLVSPHFLFRIERDPDPANPRETRRLNDYEIATRLSYFLWSSMPDDELFRLAGSGQLRKPAVLAAQVRRMLADPKSRALAENFAGQWLETRNLNFVKPDPDRFPQFDQELRDAMTAETRMFFEAIAKEDRSILEFIDGKFTFLNERLARHYGIPGVTGSEFRRVALDGVERSGVLTQASVLTVSSYPARTSPVIRGKWILENFLASPPPPPPPNAPNLDESAVGSKGSLRQQLEQHRSNAVCASCHARMDPLGFGLENYDAIGAWRTRDGNFPIDATGTLPNGKSFSAPVELKRILRSDANEFARCLTEKMLTYALGRGLERYDKPAVNSIVRRLAAGRYRFSKLVLEIVNSVPFQMRRGDGGKTS